MTQWGPRPAGQSLKDAATGNRWSPESTQPLLPNIVLDVKYTLEQYVFVTIVPLLFGFGLAAVGILEDHLWVFLVGVLLIIAGSSAPYMMKQVEGRTHRRQIKDYLTIQRSTWLQLAEAHVARSSNPDKTVRSLSRADDGGFFAGVTPDRREWCTVPKVHGVLVLGPSQSGKTSGLIIPGLLSATGPAVATSTKLDVLFETCNVRSQLGRIWLFDPSRFEARSGEIPDGILDLRWSPLTSAQTWDGARRVAQAMVEATRKESGSRQDGGYWEGRAKTLLSALFHAAAVDTTSSIDSVREWITSEDFVTPLEILKAASDCEGPKSRGAQLAFRSLVGIEKTPDRERGSVVATAELVTDVYDSEHGADHAMRPNFDVNRFVQSRDTVYITAPSQHQRSYAPIIVGLLNDIKSATFEHGRATPASVSKLPPVLFMLDEVSNIAPLADLPDILSEAGGQGLQVVACLQDLAQARARWGREHGLLSKCRTKIILPGIAESEDLEALSTILGDWDRPYYASTLTYDERVSSSSSTSVGKSPKAIFFSDTSNRTASREASSGTSRSYQTSVQRERLLSPSEVSRIPSGHAIMIRGTEWKLITLEPHYRSNVWRLVKEACPRLESHGTHDDEALLTEVDSPTQGVPVRRLDSDSTA